MLSSLLRDASPHFSSVIPFSPFIVISVLLFSSPAATTSFLSDCPQSFDCGFLVNLSYPFTSGGDCGPPEFQLICETDPPELIVETLRHRVLRLDQKGKTMTLARSDLWDTTCPEELTDSTLNSTLFTYAMDNEDLTINYGCFSTLKEKPSNLFSCANIYGDSVRAYFLTGSVPTDPLQNIVHCTSRIGVKIGKTAAFELTANPSSLEEVLMEGFHVNYSDRHSDKCAERVIFGKQCGFDWDSSQTICLCDNGPCHPPEPFWKRNLRLIIAIGIPGVAGIVVICFVIICSVKRGCLSSNALICGKRDAKDDHINAKDDHIDAEEIIKNYGSVAPKRYTYSDVKKLTNSLKDKVGQGGYGVVYKGKLPDGRIVAVKVLSESKGNGEEFINEVASISGTSHVNIVTLLGFCYERTKRALIYEFVPNGSLDKFIYDNGSSITKCHLDSRTMFQIAIGVARGLEYLHRGCRTRILHFDIKPHNILLGEDFCPKISDFGLAKLCKTKESIVSMTGMRGTAGYIAPEVFSRSFGGVSHKSDVYSYGMLVLEMVGGRKKFDAGVSHTSEVYFPHWIYNKLERGETFDTYEDTTEDEDDVVKRMMIVSLWCIQTNPSDRPSMGKVIEMFECNFQSLQFPAKPFLNSPARAPQNSSTTS